jgi:HK97 family phage prohead protease|tara:strand:+ start:1934 stop:2788 length:855 start_codon:yes stop_codon:yes gene_type:complete
MPLPKPSSGESRSDFMSRCLSDAKIVNEFSDQAQRVAVCMTQYEGKKMTDEPIENPDVEVETEVEFKNEQLDVSFEVKTSDDDEQQGMFSGYGSIFNNKDLGNDVVMQGAFAQSIGRKGAKAVKLLYQHKQDEPIGIFDEIIEDRKGLKVKGRLAMGTQRGREVYELMKMGAIDGLSIGYRVEPKGYHYDEKRKRRYLKSVDLMEISAVTFPMNPRARIQAVKGAERTVRDWEQFLRDEGSLSRTEAKAAASAVSKALEQWDAVKEEQPEVLEAIDRFTNILKS